MKFSIVTPVYNTERWIADAIESVLSQAGDFEIEYVIRDGVSTDGTMDILRSYEQRLKAGDYPIHCRGIHFQIFSEKDGGMYQAINRGFAHASGDIYAWINADDRYEPGAFQRIQEAFRAFPEIQWLKGITSTIDEHGTKIRPGVCHLYYQDWLQKGIYGQEAYFVEQDSVFWRAELWHLTKGIPEHLRFAGDYWLWQAFARYAPLWSLNAPISSFRKRQGQLSKDVNAYKNEQREIRPTRSVTGWRSRIFFSLQSRLSRFIPATASLFPRLYPLFFPGRSSDYLEPIQGRLEKRKTDTYLVPPPPSM